MVKVLLVDDEPHANELLKFLLEKHFPSSIEVVGIAQSVQEACNILSTELVNLVFLDIHMPGEDGFSLFNYHPTPSFDVIFTTAFDQYAIKAFKYSAFDYILKPLDKRVLTETLQRYLSHKNPRRIEKEQLNLLRDYIQRKETENQRIVFHTLSGIEMPTLNSIICIKANGNYSEIYLDNNTKIVVSLPLKTIESRLPEELFFRTHKSYIVALNAVKSYDKKEKIVCFNNGLKAEVSFRRENDFLTKF